MGFLNKYNGNSWEDVPVRTWNGSKWVEPEVKKWNGDSWKVLNQQQYTSTFEADWSQAYGREGKLISTIGDKIYQGENKYSDSSWGIMQSLIGFDDVAMRSALMGAKIDKVELYLKSEHWYYSAGGTAVIGYHNHDLKPTIFSHSRYGAKSEKFSSRGQALWIDMPIELGTGIRDGNLKGISVYANSSNDNYYGYFHGVKDGIYKPKLKITYTK